MPDFLVLSQDRACAYEPPGTEVCISITNPGATPPELSERFRAVLRLTFTDIAEPSPYAWDRLFSPDNARDILAFVAQWWDAERIVIHCQAGLSRSPGVALALCDLHGLDVTDLEQRFPLWNTWVRSELVRCGTEGDVVVQHPARD